LSDEAILEVNRTDLVEVAQKCDDEELSRRGLDEQQHNARLESRVISGPSSAADEEEVAVDETAAAGDKPAWIEEAACVCSYSVHPGQHLAPRM